MIEFLCCGCGAKIGYDGIHALARCLSCGLIQSLPTNLDPGRVQLYNQAKERLHQNDCLGAKLIFQNIIASFPDDAESYWQVFLCEYGVQYVKDTKCGVNNYVITLSETNLEYPLENYYYKQACYKAPDDETRSFYRQQAKEIDELVCEIISRRIKDHYDIFISYKSVRSENNQSTSDSKDAGELYESLMQRGYSVFQAEATMKDKIGVKRYEPYIYAAINSAKIMVLIASKQEYINAEWVKNEWMRYINRIRKAEDIQLIVVHGDFEIPKEIKEAPNVSFASIQSVAWKNEIVQGIMRLLTPDQEVALLEQASYYMKKKDWDRARTCCDMVLDENFENSRAYLYLCMIESKKSNYADFLLSASFPNPTYLKRAIQYSTGDLQEELLSIEKDVQEKIREKMIKSRRCSNHYTLFNGAIYTAKYTESFPQISNIQSNVIKIVGIKDGIACLTSSGEMVLLSSQDLMLGGNFISLKLHDILDITSYGEALSCLIKNGWVNLISRDASHSYPIFTQRVFYNRSYISVVATRHYIVGLLSDGRVETVDMDGKNACPFSWKNIVQLAAGEEHVIGLKSDGTVVATGENSNGQCNVSGWSAIVAIFAGTKHTVGLRFDGTVVATGDNINGQCDVKNFKDIATLIVSDNITVGIKNDGNIVHVPRASHKFTILGDPYAELKKTNSIDFPFEANNNLNQKLILHTSIFRNDNFKQREIAARLISGSDTGDIINLDGFVKSIDNFPVENLFSNVKIKKIFEGGAIASDGKIVIRDREIYHVLTPDGEDCSGRILNGNCFIDAAAGSSFIVCLKADGTLIYLGEEFRGSIHGADEKGFKSYRSEEWANATKEYAFFQWKNITSIVAGNYFIVALISDGTVRAFGSVNFLGSSIYADLEHWNNIIEISAGSSHFCGLRNDGTVVGYGYIDAETGKIDVASEVSKWSDMVYISCGPHSVLGVKRDGTVSGIGVFLHSRISAKGDYNLIYKKCELKNAFKDIIAAKSGICTACLLTFDGRVRYLHYIYAWDGAGNPHGIDKNKADSIKLFDEYENLK